METKIEIINNWKLPDILNKLKQGEIKIPRFQRDYSWERPKVVLLLNSIYLQYPIGTFFLWIAPPNYNTFIRTTTHLEIEQNTNKGETQFILDGQQRLLSLYMAFKGLQNSVGDYRKICFNPARKSFVLPRRKNVKYNYEAWKLFDDKKFKEISEELKNDSERIYNEWINCKNIINNYPISVVKTLNYELDDVVEIFERINQGGKKLSSFDLVHATTWSRTFDLKSHIDEFNNSERVRNTGGISEKVFTHSLALNAFDDCRNSYQLKLNSKIAENLWGKTKSSLLKSIDFLKEMRISTGLSAYQSHIIVLQYFFFNAKSNNIPKETRKKIEKWFWDSKFEKRYSISTYSKIKEDSKWINSLEK